MHLPSRMPVTRTIKVLPDTGNPEKLRAVEEARKAVFVEKMVGARNKSRELTPPWQEC